MGHKVHPYGFRIGINKPWLAKWYADRDYATLLQEDMRIRELVARQLSNASVSQVEIERGINHVTVTVHSAKPGIVIGKAGAKGVKIQVSGRLGGAEMSRTEWDREGRIPLGTLRADISYGVVHARTTYGRIGVKAWVYRGEQLGERPGSARTEPREPRRATTGAAGTRTRAAGSRATTSRAGAAASA